MAIYLLTGFIWAAYNGQLDDLSYWEAATYCLAALILHTSVTPRIRATVSDARASGTVKTQAAKVYVALQNGVSFPDGVQGTSPKVGDFTGLKGADPMDVLARVPKDWTAEPADRGTGVVFRDPANPKYNSVRIMNGKPNAKYLGSRGAYLRVLKSGSYVDDAGNKDPNAHIPLKGNPSL